jgi:hypothetical protein
MIYLKIPVIIFTIVLLIRYLLVPVARHLFEIRYEKALRNNQSGIAGTWSKLYCMLPGPLSI